ncbi:glycosyl hydrolase [Paramyrothecium foliicola]|nr:glycosyl hydrolase [Paramyrothecium foliicola]
MLTYVDSGWFSIDHVLTKSGSLVITGPPSHVLKSKPAPHHLSTTRKWIIIWASSMGPLFASFAAISYAPAKQQLTAAWGLSNVAILTGITAFTTGFAFAPMILTPMSKTWGRMPDSLTTGIIFLACEIGCAATPIFGGMLAARFSAGVRSSTYTTVSGGVSSDLYVTNSRNIPMAVFSGVALFNTGLGPLISGFVADSCPGDGSFGYSLLRLLIMTMWLRLESFAILYTLALLPAFAEAKDFTTHVNLFLGTEGPTPGSSYQGGNVFPGVTLPFGGVKVGIDTTRWDTRYQANAGYTVEGNVTAITMLHVSGTGGAPTYGLIPQMPLTTLEGVNLLDNLTYMQPRSEHDVAEVGYYKTSLRNGVTAEMSANMHVGIIKYQFPSEGSRHILVDLSHYLPTRGKESQWYSNGVLEQSEDGSWYSGYGVYREGWSLGGDYKVYFCGRFDTSPDEAKLFSGKYTDPYWPNTTDVEATFINGTSIRGGREGYQYAKRIGGLFSFSSDTSTIISKVGISWISADKACQFINDEIPHWNLNKTVSEAKQKWNSEVLSKIDVQTQNHTQLTMFYTGLYHAHLMPSDRTGENPHWVSDEPYYDDFYTLWDTFRCTHALISLILPDRQVDMIRAMIDIWRHERFMPEGRSHNHNGRVQGGSNSDNVLADAYVKKLDVHSRINWGDGYAAMRTNAELQPYNNFDFNDATGSTKEGRSALDDWKTYGYVTASNGRSISKTVEYSLNDFAVSQVAKGEAFDEAAKYLNRSAGWQKIWLAEATALNYTGFLAPFQPNGTVLSNYDPLSCGECNWQAISYEGTPWEYSFTIPHDMSTLIARMGGATAFERRLDTSFVPGLGQQDQGNNGIGSMIYNPGNEPSFMTAFLYNYLQRKQWKSAMRSKSIVDEFYHSGSSGIPGNDDAGSMSSWLVWNMIGLYPVVTQPVYLILSPRFSNTSIRLGESGSTLRITAEGLEEGHYVQSLKVNGKAWNKSWVSHEDLVGTNSKGGLLEFVMGGEPQEWDIGEVPPSPGALLA